MKIEPALAWIKLKAAEVWANPAGRYAVFFVAGAITALVVF